MGTAIGFCGRLTALAAVAQMVAMKKKSAAKMSETLPKTEMKKVHKKAMKKVPKKAMKKVPKTKMKKVPEKAMQKGPAGDVVPIAKRPVGDVVPPAKRPAAHTDLNESPAVSYREREGYVPIQVKYAKIQWWTGTTVWVQPGVTTSNDIKWQFQDRTGLNVASMRTFDPLACAAVGQHDALLKAVPVDYEVTRIFQLLPNA